MYQQINKSTNPRFLFFCIKDGRESRDSGMSARTETKWSLAQPDPKGYAQIPELSKLIKGLDKDIKKWYIHL